MYKNIIFDLGGVVVDFKPRDFLMDHFLNKRVRFLYSRVQYLTRLRQLSVVLRFSSSQLLPVLV